jgi:DNA mismatch endonuclease (patch repair protein)
MAKKETRKIALSKSEQMSRVRSRDTEPELLVRRLLSEHGVRYRLHRRDLPGTPDVFVGRLKLAVFVNGCFWHGHGCPRAGRPRTNADFWQKKIAGNVERDRRSRERLKGLGIKAVTLWTCEVAGFSAACRKIARRYAKAFR